MPWGKPKYYYSKTGKARTWAGRKARKYRKTYKRYRPRVQRWALGNNFPSVCKMKMRYSTNGTLNSGGAADYTVVDYRANSIYDPQTAVGGGQPSAYTIAATRYGMYSVKACKVECRWIQSSDTINAFVGFMAADDGTVTWPNSATSWVQQVREGWNKDAVGIFLDCHNVPTGKMVGWTKKYISMKRILGPKANDNDNVAEFGANPTASGTIRLFAAAADEASFSVSTNYELRITYYCILTEPLRDYTN